MPTPYAATPQKPAWPREGRPIYPSNRSRLMARMARITICVRSPIQYGDRNAGPASRNIARATRTGSLHVRRGGLGSAIPASWLQGQDDDHGRKQREVRELGHKRFAIVVYHADDDGSDNGAFETAHAADDHDHERQRQQIEIHPRVTAEDRPATH